MGKNGIRKNGINKDLEGRRPAEQRYFTDFNDFP